jgi:lactate permease
MVVLAYAYVANYSGMSEAMGLMLALTGGLFPFFSPLLGWLGVFITGSDTSANVLFGSLQVVTATKIGMSSSLAIAANTIGGGAAKMISLQSISMAVVATGLEREADVLRITLSRSILYAILIGVICYVLFLI